MTANDWTADRHARPFVAVMAFGLMPIEITILASLMR
jgi:hypothetical protein